MSPLRGLAVALVVVLCPAGQSVSPAQGPLPYEVAIHSEMQVKSPGLAKPQPMTARTTLAYRLVPEGEQTELVVRGMSVKITGDGKTLMDTTMGRESASFQRGDNPAARIPYAQATPSLKSILDQFDAPIARFSNADPAARELLVPEDSPLVENGVIEQARFFHVPFLADKDSWELPVRFSMGNNQFAKGNLTYRKGSTEPDGQVNVEVSGELRASGKLGLGEVKEGTYKVSGRQLYNPATSAWTSGEIAMDVTLVMESGGHEAGSASGTMKVSLMASAAETEEPIPPAPSSTSAPETAAPAK